MDGQIHLGKKGLHIVSIDTLTSVFLRYVPYPGGGKKWGGNGVGDDLYSFGFDGAYFWTGGRKTLVVDQLPEEPFIRKGDVVGVALDLAVPIITFTFNGMKIRASFRDFNLDGMFFPVMSCSSKLR